MSIALADALEAVELEEGRTYRCEVHGRQVEVRVLAKSSPSPSGLAGNAILEPNVVRKRLEDLRDLKDGWLDGKGRAPSSEALDWFSKTFDANYPDDLPRPFVYPTAEGGIQLEWSLGEHELSLEIDLATHSGEWHRLNMQTQRDETRTIPLDDASEWIRLSTEIRQLPGSRG